jgi:hypothetical protein
MTEQGDGVRDARIPAAKVIVGFLLMFSRESSGGGMGARRNLLSSGRESLARMVGGRWSAGICRAQKCTPSWALSSDVEWLPSGQLHPAMERRHHSKSSVRCSFCLYSQAP